MLEGAAAEIDRVQGFLADYRQRAVPMMSEVLAAIGGSSQRADVEMVQLLRASAASLDVALGALSSAAREVRRASPTQQDPGAGHVRY